jgi:5,10-methenyltetrahydrofolate synthetase
MKTSPKNSTRKILKSSLQLLSFEEKFEKNLQISKKIHSTLIKIQAHIQLKNPHLGKIVVGGFFPLIDEPVWYHHFELKVLDNLGDILLAFPVLDRNHDLGMNFLLSSIKELKWQKRGSFGIFAPVSSNQISSKKEKIEPDILLIPGLCFSRQFERLGRGKGFYDHFCAHYRGIKIGVCYSEQLVEKFEENLFEAHDQKMNAIITEKEFLNFDVKI